MSRLRQNWKNCRELFTDMHSTNISKAKQLSEQYCKLSTSKTVDLNEIHSQFTVTVGYNYYLANTLWAGDFYHVKVNKGTACQWANYHA